MGIPLVSRHSPAIRHLLRLRASADHPENAESPRTGAQFSDPNEKDKARPDVFRNDSIPAEPSRCRHPCPLSRDSDSWNRYEYGKAALEQFRKVQ